MILKDKHLRSEALEKINMTEDREMVFTECAQWVNDWVSANPVQLVDAWDLSQWMEDDMREATQSFLHY